MIACIGSKFYFLGQKDKTTTTTKMSSTNEGTHFQSTSHRLNPETGRWIKIGGRTESALRRRQFLASVQEQQTQDTKATTKTRTPARGSTTTTIAAKNPPSQIRTQRNRNHVQQAFSSAAEKFWEKNGF